MTEYFTFEGVAKRQEYWAMVIISMVLSVVGLAFLESAPLLALIVFVPTLWYNLATTVRRIRDTGNNVWWILIFLVPLVAYVALVVFGVMKSAEAE